MPSFSTARVEGFGGNYPSYEDAVAALPGAQAVDSRAKVMRGDADGTYYYIGYELSDNEAAARPVVEAANQLNNEEPITLTEALEDQFAAYLKYGPQLSSQDFAQLSEYAPKEAQLGYDIASKYFPLYQNLARDARSADRSADIEDVTRLAPDLQLIRRSGEDPQATATRDLLFKQIFGELEGGSKLTPEQELDVTEQIRSAQFARGFGEGQGSANREAVEKALEGFDMAESRQKKALNLLDFESRYSPDPFAAILGRPATATTSGSQLQQGSAPQSQTAGSLDTGFVGQNYWNTFNSRLADTKYKNQLAIAKANPYLDDKFSQYL